MYGLRAGPLRHSCRAGRSQRIHPSSLGLTKLSRRPAKTRRGPDFMGVSRRLRVGQSSLLETGDTATGGHQAVNAGATPALLAGRPSGFVGGGQLAVDYQVDRVVLGIEADWQWANLIDNQTVSTSVATFNQFTANAQQDIEFFVTARSTRANPDSTRASLRNRRTGLRTSSFQGRLQILPVSAPAAPPRRPTTGRAGPRAGDWNTRSRRTGRPRLNICITISEVSRSKSLIRDPGCFHCQSVGLRGNIVRAGVNYRFYGDDSDYEAIGMGRLIDKQV
jgi:hypothetical protein